MFEQEIKYIKLIIEKLNLKKVATSKFLKFKTFMFYTSSTHKDFFKYKKKLTTLVTDNLWVEINLNCFLYALGKYKKKNPEF